MYIYRDLIGGRSPVLQDPVALAGFAVHAASIAFVFQVCMCHQDQGTIVSYAPCCVRPWTQTWSEGVCGSPL